MRYRKLTATGDYSFGQGQLDFYINLPQTVGQAVLTNLKLFLGEWFLDLTTGMPWLTQVIGVDTSALYDNAIKTQIINTAGVTRIVAYTSVLNAALRHLEVKVTILTIFSPAPISLEVNLPLSGYGIGGYGQLPYGT